MSDSALFSLISDVPISGSVWYRWSQISDWVPTYGFMQTENRNSKLLFIGCRQNGKQTFVFLVRQTINSKWCLLFQQTCPSILKSIAVYKYICPQWWQGRSCPCTIHGQGQQHLHDPKGVCNVPASEVLHDNARKLWQKTERYLCQPKRDSPHSLWQESITLTAWLRFLVEDTLP